MSIAGKTTFIRMLHGSLKPDDESIEVPEFRVSYKPQKISPKFPGSVRPPAHAHALNTRVRPCKHCMQLAAHLQHSLGLQLP